MVVVAKPAPDFIQCFSIFCEQQVQKSTFSNQILEYYLCVKYCLQHILEFSQIETLTADIRKF